MNPALSKPKCYRCRGRKDLLYCSRNRKNPQYICRKCQRERIRKYRTTKNGKKKTNEAIYRSVKKFPERQKARQQLRDAVKRGKIKRPSHCSQCKKRKKVEGHHTDYKKPLTVIWACRGCHRELDKKQHEKTANIHN